MRVRIRFLGGLPFYVTSSYLLIINTNMPAERMYDTGVLVCDKSPFPRARESSTPHHRRYGWAPVHRTITFARRIWVCTAAYSIDNIYISHYVCCESCCIPRYTPIIADRVLRTLWRWDLFCSTCFIIIILADVLRWVSGMMPRRSVWWTLPNRQVRRSILL
jgi:hypothetical protein